MTRWRVIPVSGAIVIGLLAAKVVIHILGWEFIALTGLVTALIGGVTFTLSILFAGAIPDYKESEKIPGEIALAIKNLYKDINIVASKEENIHSRMHKKVQRLLNVIRRNFKEGTWKQHEINREMDSIDEDIVSLAEKDVQANFIIKMRSEMSNIERLSNRIETIKDTTFLPPARSVMRILVAMVMGMMLFVKVDPYYEALIITGILGFLLVGLVYLIGDMDDPFGGEGSSFADVDLEHIHKMQLYVESKSGLRERDPAKPGQV